MFHGLHNTNGRARQKGAAGPFAAWLARKKESLPARPASAPASIQSARLFKAMGPKTNAQRNCPPAPDTAPTVSAEKRESSFPITRFARRYALPRRTQQDGPCPVRVLGTGLARGLNDCPLLAGTHSDNDELAAILASRQLRPSHLFCHARHIT